MARTKPLWNTIAGVLVALFAVVNTAMADEYPSKPVKIIVPFSPGGINDVAARVVAAHLTKRLGKQVIVENKAGAGGVVGTEIATQAPADGYTLTVVSIANAIHPALYKLRYDPQKSFDMVSMFVTSPNMLAVNPRVAGKERQGVHCARQVQTGRHSIRFRRRRRLAASCHGAV